ncbi:ATP synthase mitochondrial F1 complex assembly factor 1 [Culicoides brevitarsis]|uniref:ATP synthase mitochondrial F1 complex assembly factor 1 n=1 Tax=Culicoides brevitarsis TaxID=469753 RepID=UPI00307C1882
MALSPILRGYQIKTIFRTTKCTFMMSSVRARSEKVMAQLKEKNPYFEKYSKKIAAVQQESPEEFLSRLEKVEKDNKKPKFGPSLEGRDYSELLTPKPSSSESNLNQTEKKLSDILKLELLEDKSAEEIKHIWLEYHKTKDCISAILEVNQYEQLMNTAKKYPIFVFPIPRNQGYEFMMFQFAENTIHFTPLLCYQVHKENAPECLSVTHYTDFKEKGIILMRGEFDSKVLSPQEAQCLVNQLQLYYCKNDSNKAKLLQTFTNTPDKFDHMDIIKELENIKLE